REALGELHRLTGQSEEAEAELLKALAIREELSQAHPELAEYQNDLAGSDEYFRTQGGGSNHSWEDAVTQDALHRPIDSVGRAAIESAFAQGLSRSEIAATIFQSQEYRQNLVESFYMRFLDRSADAFGMGNALNALNIGWTDERVIAGTIGEPVIS